MELNDILWVVFIGLPAIAGIVVNYFAKRASKTIVEKDGERH